MRKIIGLVLVGIAVLFAVVAMVWTPFDPVHAVPSESLQGSSLTHLMGTDQYGRDVLSRVMDGARTTLTVAVASVLLSALIGVPLGVVAGMKRGWTDGLIMRTNDLLLAFPALLLAIVFTAVFGGSMWIVVLAIGIAGIPGFARVSRVGALQVMAQDYVLSARVSKVPGFLIAWRHVLPNIASTLAVQVSVALALSLIHI